MNYFLKNVKLYDIFWKKDRNWTIDCEAVCSVLNATLIEQVNAPFRVAVRKEKNKWLITINPDQVKESLNFCFAAACVFISEYRWFEVNDWQLETKEGQWVSSKGIKHYKDVFEKSSCLLAPLGFCLKLLKNKNSVSKEQLETISQAAAIPLACLSLSFRLTKEVAPLISNKSKIENNSDDSFKESALIASAMAIDAAAITLML